MPTPIHPSPRELGVAGGDAAEVLYAKLKVVFSRYGIRDFAVYVIEEGDAYLSFSSGLPRPMTADGADRMPLADFPGLSTLLRGDAPLAVWGTPGREGAMSPVPGVSLGFRINFEGQAVGFILVYGELSPAAVSADGLKDMTNLVTLFSNTFAQRHSLSRLRRDRGRAVSQLREIREGMAILLLRDRQKIFDAVLGRALTALSSETGMIWLTSGGEWRCAHATGVPPADGMAAMERLVQKCLETERPALLSSLSGEEITDFDIETLHIASAAVFPLRTPSATLGAIVAFDATVSRDAVSVVEGTALAGGVAIESWQHSQKLLDEHRLREQMTLAAQAQQRLLPAKGGRFPGLTVSHYSRYCEEAGGDYVDAIATREPHLSVFTVGDVSGHGFSAALLMVDVRARLRTHVEDRRVWSPAEVMTDLNRSLCVETGAGEFVTLFLATLDSRTGVLRYANAGHEPPLLFKAASKSWITLETTGLVLGVEAGALYETRELALAPGDVLVVTTDGVTEAPDADGRPFGTDSIKATVASHRALDASMLRDALVERTLSHCRATTFADDLTYLVIKVDRITLTVAEACPQIAGEAVLSERLPSTRAAKDRVLARLRDLLAGWLPATEFHGTFMAVEEALTNAVVHGNREDEAREVAVRLYKSQVALTLVVLDQGDGFDPFARVAAYDDPEALHAASGRGLLIMASMLDAVTYFDQGRGVCLVKELSREPG